MAPRAPRRAPFARRVHGEVQGERRSVWDEVYAAVRRIPRGRVMTYGQVSELLGSRISPKAVGWAMHTAPEDVPWQRVVNASGRCSTERRHDIPLGMQRGLLESEGVAFRLDGSIDLDAYRHVSRAVPGVRRTRRERTGMTLVALLRGINVGRAKRVAMSELRRLIEGIGFRDVRTVLNSGNLLLVAPRGERRAAAARIREAIASSLEVEALVVVVSAADLAEAVAQNPLAAVATDPSRLLVAFPEEPGALRRLSSLAGEDWRDEVLAVGRRAAYLWCPRGVAAGRLAKAVERALDGAVTMRNWATATRVCDLAAAVGRGEA
ncbi:MAG: DUF1697 domain-containing protein [Acidobacteriota bacterium]